MPGHHALQGEIRPQRFLVEIVQRGALLFGVIGHVPGLEWRSAGPFERPAEFEQLLVLLAETRLGLGLQVFEKGQGARAGVGHAVFQHQVREILESQKPRFFPAQFQDAGEDRAIVAFARRGPHDCRRCTPRGGSTDCRDRSSPPRSPGPWRVKRQPSRPLRAALARADASAVGGRPATSASSAITSSKALVESRTFSENLVVSWVSSTSSSSSRFLPAASRSAPCLRNVSTVLWRKRRRSPASSRAFPGRGVRLDALPQPRMQRNPRIECADLRLHGIERGAQLRVGGHRFQVPDHAHGIVERLGQLVERPHGVVEGSLPRRGGDGLQAGARVARAGWRRPVRRRRRGCGRRGHGIERGGAGSARWNWASSSYRVPGAAGATRGAGVRKPQNGYHRENMDSDPNGGPSHILAEERLNVFALVIYIPDPLGGSLDDLRRELVPHYNPHAHVSVLPPRPLAGDWQTASGQARALTGAWAPFDVELTELQMFPGHRRALSRGGRRRFRIAAHALRHEFRMRSNSRSRSPTIRMSRWRKRCPTKMCRRCASWPAGAGRSTGATAPFAPNARYSYRPHRITAGSIWRNTRWARCR